MNAWPLAGIPRLAAGLTARLLVTKHWNGGGR